MDVAVRYFSFGGGTKAIAQEIAGELGVEAISIADEPALAEPCDVLFLGGAPYFNLMDPKLEAYARAIDPAKVGKVVLFTTSNWSRRTVLALHRILEEKGIPVDSEHFYAHMFRVEQRKPAARGFARSVADPCGTRATGPDVTAILAESAAAALITAGAALVVTFALDWLSREK